MDQLCYLCLVFVMRSRLFICCLVVTCWERADLLLLLMMFNCDFVTFSCGILGLAWYLIVSIPDLCRLSYFGPKANQSLITNNCTCDQVNKYNRAKLSIFTLI